MIISAIVAAAENHVIGNGDDLPWHIPTDFNYFKRTTLNHHVIMGRKTFATMGKPFRNRTNIIVTRDPLFLAAGIFVTHSIEEALTIAADNGETEAFIIGGGEIYRQSMNLLDKVYLTRVHAIAEGGVTFPELDLNVWQLISQESHPATERDQHPFTFEVYERAQ